MKKKIIYISFLLLLGSSYACNNNEKEVDATVENEQTINEEEIVELEATTEEVSTSTMEMEEEINELSNEVDSLLTDI